MLWEAQRSPAQRKMLQHKRKTLHDARGLSGCGLSGWPSYELVQNPSLYSDIPVLRDPCILKSFPSTSHQRITWVATLLLTA